MLLSSAARVRANERSLSLIINDELQVRVVTTVLVEGHLKCLRSMTRITRPVPVPVVVPAVPAVAVVVLIRQ
jgi:hypothetical protein